MVFGVRKRPNKKNWGPSQNKKGRFYVRSFEWRGASIDVDLLHGDLRDIVDDLDHYVDLVDRNRRGSGSVVETAPVADAINVRFGHLLAWSVLGKCARRLPRPLRDRLVTHDERERTVQSQLSAFWDG